MRSGSEAFFQVAVALIPAFLFGGAMRKPERGWPSGRWTQFAIFVVLSVSVCAEILAIRGVIDPAVDRWEQLWVVVTIVGGTVLIAALTAWSWLSQDPQDAPAELDKAESRQRPSSSASRTRTIGWIALVGCLAAFCLAALGITKSLDNVEARNELTRADRQVRTTSAVLAKTDQEVTSARTLLITSLLGMRSRSREKFSSLVEAKINAIDDIVQPVLRKARPPSATIDSAVKDLVEPTSRLRGPFYKNLGTQRADPEEHLGALAVDRLIRAEIVRLAAKERSARARRHHAKACRKVTGTGSGQEPPPGCPTARA